MFNTLDAFGIHIPDLYELFFTPYITVTAQFTLLTAIIQRKCDGVAPCKYCVSKNIKCEFSQQKKRGPSKKPKPEKDNKSPTDTKPTTTIMNNDNVSKSGVVKVNSNNSSVSTIGTLSEGDNIANMALQGILILVGGMRSERVEESSHIN